MVQFISFSHLLNFFTAPPSQLKRTKTLFLLGPLGRIIENLQQMQLNASKANSKADLTEELKKISSDKGFRISDNQGSGNCMFYALSEQLETVKGIKIQHGELRQTLVHYLRENPKLVSWR